MRILLAEDNVVNQKVATRLLEKLGCRVDVVASGQEVVTAWLRKTYDVIIMDGHMPDMDGYAATAAIREYETRHSGHIPIVAMTANAMLGDRERCLAVGMDDYISKPVRTGEVTSLLQRWGTGAPGTASPVPVAG